MLFAAVHESAYGTSRHSLHCNTTVAVGLTTDKGRLGG
jgi:hypothetical protein